MITAACTSDETLSNSSLRTLILMSRVVVQKLITPHFSKKFSQNYGTPKVHYRARKSPPLDNYYLESFESSRHCHSYFCKIYFIIIIVIILPSMRSSSKCSRPFRFSNQFLYAFLISPIRPMCPTFSL